MTHERGPQPTAPRGASRAPWSAGAWRGRRAALGAGLVVAVAILGVALVALLRPRARLRSAQSPPAPTYVGRASCRECHRDQYDRWIGSDHDLAMQAANDSTVLGDFNDATFEDFGVASRFYRDGTEFWVHTQGPDGRMGEYQIAYTFGVHPLQQYLVRFPGGRMQCLTIAWDVQARRWYNLYPKQYVPPGDWLHWTGGAMNWNGMCAECHSTNLQKSYDPQADSYATTWSEIDVSCEACHGPCSAHVAWARQPAAARPDSADHGLVVSTRGMSAHQQVELCARCHARRSLLEDFRPAAGSDLLDHMVPTLLDDGIYFPDGQIQDEDYEYGSFVQSKMYRKDVRCTDCHDPHSGRRRAEDNALCLRCHKPEVFDTSAHHFHKPGVAGGPSPGWLCASCHMPRRPYMGIDWRADHSLRVPRPDLAVQLGNPSACSQAGCHADKPLRWAADAFARWYRHPPRPHYGPVLAAARAGQPQARDALVQMTRDDSCSAIVRATAVSRLDRVAGAARPLAAADAAADTAADTLIQRAVTQALDDPESLVRRAAVEQARLLPPRARARELAERLRDPVKTVRIRAAAALAEVPDLALTPAGRANFEPALADYVAWLTYQLDLPSSGYNLGNLYVTLGRAAEAERAFLVSLKVDPLYVQTRVNYALLLGAQGRNAEAEAQLRAAVKAAPDLAAAWFNLGLLLAEMGRMTEALDALERATHLAPGFARAHYNLGLAYRDVGKLDAAGRALRRALELEPANADCLFALADLELRRGRINEAQRIVQRWQQVDPDDPRAREMQAAIDAKPRTVERAGRR